MRPVKTFWMLNKRWRYILTGHLGFQTDEKGRQNYNDGHTDDPEIPRRAVKVLQRLRGKKRLETILHEAGGHAGDFKWREEYVEQWARDLSDLLWRLGYRAPDD